jgi:membrane-associated phospholipid phosphatase
MMESRGTVVTREIAGRVPSRVERLLLMPAVSDWLLAGYFLTVVFGLSRAPAGGERNFLLGLSSVVLSAFLFGCYVYRMRFEPRVGGPTYAQRLAYHLWPLCTLLTLYFHLRPILPLVNGVSYDEQLYQLDLRVFGFEPTVFLEKYSTRAVVEWFAFFYYSYFFFVAMFLFIHLLTNEDDRQLSHFATGLVMVVTIGHFVYMLVPGFGPYLHLAHEYDGPLPGGPFYDMVLRAVAAGGSLRDIFPSLHTALPVYLTMFAWRHHRRHAPLATFFAANIAGATLVLRWHYALDVIAGLLLATFAFWASPRLVELYQSRRNSAGLGSLRRW